MEVTFKFSEVTLKSEMTAFNFFSLFATRLLPSLASFPRAAGGFVELLDCPGDWLLIVGNQLSSVRSERLRILHDRPCFGEKRLRVLHHRVRSCEEPLCLREQASNLVEDVAGLPFGAAEHPAQTLDRTVHFASELVKGGWRNALKHRVCRQRRCLGRPSRNEDELVAEQGVSRYANADI